MCFVYFYKMRDWRGVVIAQRLCCNRSAITIRLQCVCMVIALRLQKECIWCLLRAL